MNTRKTMDGQGMIAMVVLCLVLSMQQIGLKATAEDAGPILQIAIRSGIATILVVVLMRLRGEKIWSRELPWQVGMVAGVLFSLEYVFLGTGLRYTTAAHGVVFLYTAPLFAALGLHIKLRSERLASLQWCGIGLAFTGIAIAFFMPGQYSGEYTRNSWLGDALCLAGGAAWGATTVLVRCSRLSHASATQTTFFQLAVGCPLLFGAAFVFGQWSFRPTPMVFADLAFQSVIVSFLVLLAWFALLRRYLASRIGVFSFMTPLFGVALGAWLLDEAIQPGFLIGALFVVAGIILVSGYEWLKQSAWFAKARVSHADQESISSCTD